MIRCSLRAAGGIAAIVVAAPSFGCGESLQSGPTQRAESARYVVVWRTQPAPAPMGQHFAVDVEICPKAGGKMPEALLVDAHMPDHRHGMNYRPSVTARGPATYRAEGLLFHMPGRWEYIFDLRADGKTDRITAVQMIE
jgi:hypothetical protein